MFMRVTSNHYSNVYSHVNHCLYTIYMSFRMQILSPCSSTAKGNLLLRVSYAIGGPVSRDSAVGIATGYGLEFESR
jgi:hypothetical protein